MVKGIRINCIDRADQIRRCVEWSWGRIHSQAKSEKFAWMNERSVEIVYQNVKFSMFKLSFGMIQS